MVIGMSLWLLCVIMIIVGGFTIIYKAIKNNINTNYRYSINLYKEGFDKTNFPLIKLRIRNKYRYFLIDTGANINLISKTAYKSIVGKGQVKLVDNNVVSGMGTTETTNAVPVIEDTISVGRDRFVEHFTISDDWDFARKQISDVAGVDIVGILGSKFFKKAKWVLDFEELVIWVKK